MNTPTEPGCYWWTWEGGRSEVLQVEQFPDGMLVVLGQCRNVPPSPADSDKWCVEMDRFMRGAKGVWGPRFPGPVQLAAMRELAAREPLCKAPDDCPPDKFDCAYCDHLVPGGDPELHDPDCPWLLAQEPRGEKP